MRAMVEELPQLVLGRQWSRWLPATVRSGIERLVRKTAYRRMPPPSFLLRPDPPVASLLFAGDLALHRWSANESPARVFQNVRPLFDEASFRVVNLETVLTDHAEPAGRIGSFLRAAPASVSCLNYLRADAALCANNHALDFGARGLSESVEVLSRAGIASCGLHDPQARDQVPGAVVQVVKGLSIGMVAATDHFGGFPPSSGLSPVWATPGAVTASIRALRAQCDIVIAQLHWGYEYVMYPLRWHRDLARQLIEEGADIVCCHHAHVVMGVERWGRGVIAHGLGNFYFGSRAPRHPFGRHGVLLRASVDGRGLIEADVIPVRTDNTGAVHLEDRACPGFHRLCGGLGDDNLLRRIEDRRVAHELAWILRDLQERMGHSDGPGLCERQQYLAAPRHEWLLGAAEASADPQWQDLGSWLRSFRDMAPEAVGECAFSAPPALDRSAWHADPRGLPGRWP